MKIELEITDGMYKALSDLFPGMTVDEVLVRAGRKVLAEAQLKAFAKAKQAEVEAEQARLNAELQK